MCLDTLMLFIVLIFHVSVKTHREVANNLRQILFLLTYLDRINAFQIGYVCQLINFIIEPPSHSSFPIKIIVLLTYFKSILSSFER